MSIISKLRRRFCSHVWEGQFKRTFERPGGTIAEWVCSKCGKVERAKFVRASGVDPKGFLIYDGVLTAELANAMRRDFEKACRK